jgi:hypothetical protein
VLHASESSFSYLRTELFTPDLEKATSFYLKRNENPDFGTDKDPPIGIVS